MLFKCHSSLKHNAVLFEMGLFAIKTCDSLPACRLALVLCVKTGILGFFPQFGVTWYVYFCAIPPAEINFKVRDRKVLERQTLTPT